MEQARGSLMLRLTCGLLVRSSLRNGPRAALEFERDNNSKLDLLTDHPQGNRRLLKKVIQRGRRRTLKGTLRIVTNRERSWGIQEHPVRLLKQTIQQGRSRRTGRRRTLSGTLRTCSRRERSWESVSAAEARRMPSTHKSRSSYICR